MTPIGIMVKIASGDKCAAMAIDKQQACTDSMRSIVLFPPYVAKNNALANVVDINTEVDRACESNHKITASS